MQRIAALLAIIFLLLVVCPGCGASVDQMKKEAENAAMQELGKYLVKCGDVYCSASISSRTTIYTQHKEALVYTNENELSDADRLNGLEWRGKVAVVLGGPTRHYMFNKWQEWIQVDINHSDNGFEVLVQKHKGGKWEVEVKHSFLNEDKQLTCADVPGTIEQEKSATLSKRTAELEREAAALDMEAAAFLKKSPEEQKATFPNKSPELQDAIRRQQAAAEEDKSKTPKERELDEWARGFKAREAAKAKAQSEDK